MYDKVKIGNLLSKAHYTFYQMWRMGKPIITEQIPTAAVSFDKAGKFTNYYWNPNFYAALTDEERVAVVIHESLHVILQHGMRGKDLKYPRLQNQVQDCVINRIVEVDFGYPADIFDTIIQKINPEGKSCTFKNIFSDPKYSNLDLTHSWEYYYQLLLENAQEMSGFISFDENMVGEEVDIDVGDILDVISGDEKEVVQKFGKGEGTEEVHVKGKSKESRAWMKAIRRWKEDFVEDEFSQWIKPNRRVQSLPDNIFLPSFDQCEDIKKKPEVAVFWDVSDSCRNMVDPFKEAVLSIPKDKFKLSYYVFDDKVQKIDVRNMRFKGFGGTNFKPIEQGLQKLKKYPHHIFVITDGYSQTVEPQFPDRWTFFLGGSYTTHYLPLGSKHYILKDFL